MAAKNYVVLGGGISGLSAAWFLSQLVPKTTRITLIERQSRLGGWVHTQRQNDQLFELGPRTLRPVGNAGRATLEMVHKLGISGQVLTTSKTSPAAVNRFIYQGQKLHQLPTSPSDLLNPFKPTSPLLRGLLFSILREPFVAAATQPDESIHSFVSRRFSRSIADNLVSAILHGIYAGNAKELSVRSAMAILWEAEQKHGSVGRGLLAPPAPSIKPATSAVLQGAPDIAPEPQDSAADSFVREVQSAASIYSFKNGMQTLTDALHEDLTRRENVEVRTGDVQRIVLGPHPEVELKDGSAVAADHIISALPASALHKLLPPSCGSLSAVLSSIPTVDVVTVNLAFRGPSSTVLPVNGFGYLIPLTEPTGILGIVFDSCAMPEQDIEGTTRLTVMMGGHRFQQYIGDVDAVTEAELRKRALDAARDHLGIKAELLEANVAVHRECIPQYTVGHHQRLTDARAEMLAHCGGALSLVGASYFGVGVNDCVLGARDLARALSRADPGVAVTGLEKLNSTI